MNFLHKYIKNQNILRFLDIFQNRFKASEMNESSTSVAYYLLLSVFPLIIAIGNTLPYLQLNPEQILPYIGEILPETIYDSLKPTIRSLLSNTDGGLLSISALGTVWAASKSVNGLQKSLNKVYYVDGKASYVLQRLYSVVMIFFFLITIIFLIFVFGLGQAILLYFSPIFKISPMIIHVFVKLRWPTTLLLLLILMISIYYYIPNVSIHFKTVLPGSIIATLSWMALTQMFSGLVKYFFKRLISYGVFGSFIIFILWLNFAAKIIIFGAILNATIEEYFYGKTVLPKSHKWGKIVEYRVEFLKHPKKAKKETVHYFSKHKS